jgi:hypothetical protein
MTRSNVRAFGEAHLSTGLLHLPKGKLHRTSRVHKEKIYCEKKDKDEK